MFLLNTTDPNDKSFTCDLHLEAHTRIVKAHYCANKKSNSNLK